MQLSGGTVIVLYAVVTVSRLQQKTKNKIKTKKTNKENKQRGCSIWSETFEKFFSDEVKISLDAWTNALLISPSVFSFIQNVFRQHKRWSLIQPVNSHLRRVLESALKAPQV